MRGSRHSVVWVDSKSPTAHVNPSFSGTRSPPRPLLRRRSTIKLLYGPGIASPGLALSQDIVNMVSLYNILTDTEPPRARPGPLRPSSSSGAGLRRPVARQIRLRREGVVAEHHRRCRRSCGGPGARLGGQGRGSSRECSAGASFWVHGTAAGPVREPFRTRSFARWPSWRPIFDNQSSGRRGQRSAHSPRARGECGVCLTRRRGRVNSRRSSRSADLERRAGPPPGPAGATGEVRNRFGG